MSGHYMIVRPRAAWLQQARTALDAWQDSEAPDARAFAAANYEQFCLFVEAWHALGQPVSDELMQLAQMRPIDDALGGLE